MKYIFKTKDKTEAKIQMAASENYAILWELTHNFERKFKNVEGSKDYMAGITHVLQELYDELEGFKDVGE